MPESVARSAAGIVTPPAKPAPADGAVPAGEGESEAPQYVTKADLDALTAKIASDFKAEIGRLRKAVKPEPAPKAADGDEPGDPADGDGKQSWHRTVTTKLQEVERREAIAQKGARRAQIRNALVAAGADPELADLAVPAVLENDAENFKIALNEQTGEYSVAYQDGTLVDWSKAFMLTAQGKRIAAPKSVPSMTGVPGSPVRAGMRQVPASQASRLSDDELKSGLVEIVPG